MSLYIFFVSLLFTVLFRIGISEGSLYAPSGGASAGQESLRYRTHHLHLKLIE
jgi:hypothetical protein